MHKRSFIHLAFVSTVAALLLPACGPKRVSFDVELSDFKFTPNAFDAPLETALTLNLTNSASVVHEFVLMKLGTQVSLPFDDNDAGNVYWEAEVEPGESGTFTFTAPTQAGEYQVVCGTPGHAEAGMLGTLTVR